MNAQLIDTEDLTALGRRALDLAVATMRHWDLLNRTPLTRLDFLLGTVEHGVRFDEIDACLATLADVCPQHGDFPFTGGAFGDTHTLDGARAHLKEVLRSVEPLRPKVVPHGKRAKP